MISGLLTSKNFTYLLFYPRDIKTFLNKKPLNNNMVNKRGLSEIVTTLIMVLLGIVIVGVIWAVVSGLVNNTRAQAELSSKCQDSAISITYADCTGTTCTITVKRDQGTDTIAGVLVTIKGAQGATAVNKSAGDLTIGTTRTVTIEDNTASSVEAKMYLDNGGKEFYCTNLAITDNVIQ